VKLFLKKFLTAIGLFDFLQCYWNMFKRYKKGLWKQERELRRNGAPDGLPLPPRTLIAKVIATGWAAQYLEGGEKFHQKMKDHLAQAELKLDDFKSILDFGCGSGRLTRHMHGLKDAKVYGSDYNPKLIKWCRDNLKFADFSVNNLNPPMKFENDAFDFIYHNSVFTHLSEENIRNWMGEFARLLRPGGVMYFNIHGDNFLDHLSSGEAENYKSGEGAVEKGMDEGSNSYATYANYDFVTGELLGDEFELLGFHRGEGKYGKDSYIVKKK
jgi:SAM-dependent methyltransferase